MEQLRTGPALLVIADDLTGANDAGVQFAKRGIRSVVLVESGDEWPAGYEVVVVNTESRHAGARVAAERVGRMANLGMRAGVRFFFKKTDSTLRGNIGAELKALLAATGERSVAFVPAFPEMGRTTRGGMHYVHGVPIGESAFANDPLSPVRESEVATVLHGSADLNVTGGRPGDDFEPGCVVFDCESRAELRGIAETLAKTNRLRVLAGSAALAEELPRVLPLMKEGVPGVTPRGPILLVNGSLNPRALEQISAAGSEFRRVRMRPENLLSEEAAERFAGETQPGHDGNLLLHSATRREEEGDYARAAAAAGTDETTLRLRIADATGRIVARLLAEGNFRTLAVFGGDTLMGIARACGWKAFVPRMEVEAGITVSNPMGSELTVISKAGGFGDAGVVGRIVEWIKG